VAAFLPTRYRPEKVWRCRWWPGSPRVRRPCAERILAPGSGFGHSATQNTAHGNCRTFGKAPHRSARSRELPPAKRGRRHLAGPRGARRATVHITGQRTRQNTPDHPCRRCPRSTAPGCSGRLSNLEEPFSAVRSWRFAPVHCAGRVPG
jgi:hypothetical protein